MFAVLEVYDDDKPESSIELLRRMKPSDSTPAPKKVPKAPKKKQDVDRKNPNPSDKGSHTDESKKEPEKKPETKTPFVRSTPKSQMVGVKLSDVTSILSGDSMIKCHFYAICRRAANTDMPYCGQCYLSRVSRYPCITCSNKCSLDMQNPGKYYQQCINCRHKKSSVSSVSNSVAASVSPSISDAK
jgi:hypothetical protein